MPSTQKTIDMLVTARACIMHVCPRCGGNKPLGVQLCDDCFEDYHWDMAANKQMGLPAQRLNAWLVQKGVAPLEAI